MSIQLGGNVMTKKRFKENASANLNVRIKPSIKKMLQDGSDQLGVTMSEYLEDLIIEEFAKPLGDISEEEYAKLKTAK